MRLHSRLACEPTREFRRLLSRLYTNFWSWFELGIVAVSVSTAVLEQYFSGQAATAVLEQYFSFRSKIISVISVSVISVNY